jgi:signal peptidase I
MRTSAAPALPVPGGPARPAARRVVVGLLVLAAVAGARTGLATPVRVSSGSMLPTLAPGDVVVTSRLALEVDDVDRGDLVTFVSPQDGERALKRVVGLPGDRVVIKDAVLHVNDSPVHEPHVDHELIDAYYSKTYLVPDGHVFVLGDHRSTSTDSRDYGPVAAGDVTGRVLVRLWPPVRR